MGGGWWVEGVRYRERERWGGGGDSFITTVKLTAHMYAFVHPAFAQKRDDSRFSVYIYILCYD